MIRLYSTETTLIKDPTQEINYKFMKRRKDQLNKISTATSEIYLKSTVNNENENILRIASKIGKAFEPLRKLEVLETSNLLSYQYESQLLDIASIESNIDKISEEAKTVILKNKISIEVINEIIENIHKLLLKYEKASKIEISIEKDKEIPTWEELVISISIKEQDFNNIIKIWDEIENMVEEIIDIKSKKYKNKTELIAIKELDDKLTIEVKELKDV